MTTHCRSDASAPILERYQMSRGVIIRKYKESDCEETMTLFYNTVHAINARDYAKEQLDVWASKERSVKNWNDSLLKNHALVASLEDLIIGFGDIDDTGYLDRLFVHKDYQGIGIATALCDRLEQYVSDKITVHASITAKPFFEKRGYKVVKEQQVKIERVSLTNYVMEKEG